MKKKLTNTTKVTLTCMGVMTLLSSLILSAGVNLEPGGEIGFVFIFLYVTLPLASLISSCVAGGQKSNLKWLMPAVCGVFGVLIPYVVFHNFDGIALSFGLYPSIIGLVFGMVARFSSIKKMESVNKFKCTNLNN